ncbi:MAG: NADH-quinone oxidoreductase subunit A [Saprospiraceae bacterium]|nr:NADH-quinone oxidoreductase subunit A [Saprospiraceae bacterium]MBK8450809.1 NADH-quinone oxidoreductase subunit A [Saprospiraceae bacterium]MBK8485110.1 NADH-quinone oxidoreductase subunit A [Saprospiraceae bacterium]MBK9223089.1 NADH-quinone oxidoreductase subunit A [Saprospiraceae bacterium]MBK9720619.1 NADH-quinone oxidoreductase subunit A [Saprospiraceae bacterium]
MESNHIPFSYVPILIQFFVAMGFVVFVLIATHLLGPKLSGKRKDASFECGLDSVGNARSPFSIRYFMTAILFVLFDVEIIFMYPWAVNFRTLGWFGFVEMLIFLALLMAGFYYVLMKGVLKWETREDV